MSTWSIRVLTGIWYLDDDLITEEEEKYYSADVDPEEMRAFRESQQNQRGRGGKEGQAGNAESGPHSGGTQGWQAQDSGMTGAGMQRAHGRLIDEGTGQRNDRSRDAARTWKTDR